MGVPIVSGRRALSPSGLVRNLAQSYSHIPKTSNPKDDAVKIALSDKTKAAEENFESNRVRRDGALPNVLGALKDIAQRIQKIRTGRSKNGSTLDEAEAKELAALEKQFQEITSSKELARLTDVLKSVGGLISSGTPLNSLAKSLIAQGAELGSNYLDLLRQGSTSNISKVNEFISSLSSVDVSGDLSGFIAKITDIENSLATSPSNAVTQSIIKAQEEAPEIEPISQIETKFSQGGAVAISLRSYGSRDLIKAAATGAIDDISQISQITLEIPDSESEEEKALKEKKEHEAKSAGGSLDIEA